MATSAGTALARINVNISLAPPARQFETVPVIAPGYVWAPGYRVVKVKKDKGHGPENFAMLRRLAIAMIKRLHMKTSIRRHRKRAAWDDSHLLTILAAAT